MMWGAKMVNAWNNTATICQLWHEPGPALVNLRRIVLSRLDKSGFLCWTGTLGFSLPTFYHAYRRFYVRKQLIKADREHQSIRLVLPKTTTDSQTSPGCSLLCLVVCSGMWQPPPELPWGPFPLLMLFNCAQVFCILPTKRTHWQLCAHIITRVHT